MNNSASKKNCPGGGGGVRYAKIDSRLICLICVEAQLSKYRKNINLMK